MGSWLRRLFGGEAKTAPRPAPARATSGSGPPPAAIPAPQNGPLALEDLVPPAAAEGDFALDDDDEALAPLIAQVREHFFANRPDPTSFPALAARVIDVVEHPDVQLNKLVAAIQQDPAISAEVLKIANSSAFRREREVTDLRQAITQLGLREIAGIAAGVAGKSVFDAETRAEFELYGDVWGRLFAAAMTTALGATWLAMQRRSGRSDVVFLGGLFHDIGKSVALRSLAGLLIGGKLTDAPSERAVLRMVEAVHVELGRAMCETWKLPAELAAIVEDHHAADLPAAPEHASLHVVRLVSGVQALDASTDPPPTLAAEVLASAAALGIDRFALRALRTQIEEVEGKVASMFDVRPAPRRQRA